MEDIVKKKNVNENIFEKKENNLNNRSDNSKNEKEYNKQGLDIKKDKKKKKKKKKICPICNIKLTLVEQTILCSCEKSFCTKHRLPHKHNCNYNYKYNKKEFLKDNNPDMNFKKINEI